MRRSWTAPPEVQQKIRDGKADVGFTPEQVALALGAPQRKYRRKTKDSEQQVWAYGRSGGRGRTRLGVGVGVIGGGPSIYSGGVSVGAGDGDYDFDRTVVIFENGKAVSVESRER